MSLINEQIRVRFAPSPTGYVHIGNFRTSLFNYLFARHNNGVLVLRVEDTDQVRLVEGSLQNLLEINKRFGVEYDEGYYIDDSGEVRVKGEYGPYLQSDRKDLYKKYALELIEKGDAYYCFCDQARLDGVRAEQAALKKPPMYDRLCRSFDKNTVSQKLLEFEKAGKAPVVRQAIPLSGSTDFVCKIYGHIVIENKTLDDQVLLKSDGFPTYHLAVVVDDHLMKITHVFRGQEYISSTPKHVLLYNTFGWQIPEFVHLPHILNPDKTKLSKRNGDVSVESFLDKGYLPESITNFIAFLGFNPKTTQEIFSLTELVDAFSLDKVHRAGAVFDIEKLDWMNGMYIRSMDTMRLVKLVKQELLKAKSITESDGVMCGYSGVALSDEFMRQMVCMESGRLHKISDITDRTKYLFTDVELVLEKLVWKKSDAIQTIGVLNGLRDFLTSLDVKDFALDKIDPLIKKFIVDNGYDNGTVLWPLRYLLTGMEKSPTPFEVLAVLHAGYGFGIIEKRINNAINLLS